MHAAVEFELEVGVIGVGKEFNFGNAFAKIAGATQFPEGGNGAIDQRRADGTCLDRQEGVRSEAIVAKRKLGMSA
jgi:hypothetical protein